MSLESFGTIRGVQRHVPPPLNLMADWRAICFLMSLAATAEARSSVACEGRKGSASVTCGRLSTEMETGKQRMRDDDDEGLYKRREGKMMNVLVLVNWCSLYMPLVSTGCESLSLDEAERRR